MEKMIAKLVDDFERGKLNRRQLIQGLAVTAASALSVAEAPAAEGRIIKAVNLNHVSFQVADYKRTRDFYADLLGMKVSRVRDVRQGGCLGGCSTPPAVIH